jgi:hypothetical protein
MPSERLPLPSIAAAAITAVILPPVGLALGVLWSARGGARSAPAPAIAFLSLLCTIALLALVGGSS